MESLYSVQGRVLSENESWSLSSWSLKIMNNKEKVLHQGKSSLQDKVEKCLCTKASHLCTIKWRNVCARLPGEAGQMPRPPPCVQSDLKTEHPALHVSEYKCGQSTSWNTEGCQWVLLFHFQWIYQSGDLNKGTNMCKSPQSESIHRHAFKVRCGAQGGSTRWATGLWKGNLRTPLCIKL